MTSKRKPRAQRLFSTTVRLYDVRDSHGDYAEPSRTTQLGYYSDGSSRLYGDKVIGTEAIFSRTAVIAVLTVSQHTMLLDRTIINHADYAAHEHAIATYQKDHPHDT